MLTDRDSVFASSMVVGPRVKISEYSQLDSSSSMDPWWVCSSSTDIRLLQT